MKKRLHNKKAGIAILISLLIISVSEMIFRAVVIGEAVLTTANLGEQLAVIALAVTILILSAKGKDRACYLCYGAWASYFILDQLFELPGTIVDVANLMAQHGAGNAVSVIGPIARILSMIGIVVIGILLIEYMNDGTICNRAFNGVCVVTVLLLLFNIVSSILGAIIGQTMLFLETFNGLYRICMIFMFTFFAYDSAKAQLKKTNLSSNPNSVF